MEVIPIHLGGGLHCLNALVTDVTIPTSLSRYQIWVISFIITKTITLSTELWLLLRNWLRNSVQNCQISLIPSSKNIQVKFMKYIKHYIKSVIVQNLKVKPTEKANENNSITRVLATQVVFASILIITALFRSSSLQNTKHL